MKSGKGILRSEEIKQPDIRKQLFCNQLRNQEMKNMLHLQLDSFIVNNFTDIGYLKLFRKINYKQCFIISKPYINIIYYYINIILLIY